MVTSPHGSFTTGNFPRTAPLSRYRAEFSLLILLLVEIVSNFFSLLPPLLLLSPLPGCPQRGFETNFKVDSALGDWGIEHQEVV